MEWWALYVLTYILAVWCVGDFKETTVLAKPVLHCGQCSACAGLIKSCEQKHCGYQWQVAKAAYGRCNEWAVTLPRTVHLAQLQARRRWALVARGAIESGGPVEGTPVRNATVVLEFSLMLSSVHLAPGMTTLNSRREGSDWIGWARRGNAGPKCYSCAGVLLDAVIRSSRSRHDDAELSSRSNWVGPLREQRPETLRLCWLWGVLLVAVIHPRSTKG